MTLEEAEAMIVVTSPGMISDQEESIMTILLVKAIEKPRMIRLKVKKISDLEAEAEEVLEEEASEEEVEVAYMDTTTRIKRMSNLKDSMLMKPIIKAHISQEVTEVDTTIEEDIEIYARTIWLASLINPLMD